jgi:hypothetical protein
VYSFVSGSLQFTPRGLKPSFNFSVGNHLGKHTIGYLSFSSNFTAKEVEEVKLGRFKKQRQMLRLKNRPSFFVSDVQLKKLVTLITGLCKSSFYVPTHRDL